MCWLGETTVYECIHSIHLPLFMFENIISSLLNLLVSSLWVPLHTAITQSIFRWWRNEWGMGGGGCCVIKFLKLQIITSLSHEPHNQVCLFKTPDTVSTTVLYLHWAVKHFGLFWHKMHLVLKIHAFVFHHQQNCASPQTNLQLFTQCVCVKTDYIKV